MGYDHDHGRGGGGGTRNLEHIYIYMVAPPRSTYVMFNGIYSIQCLYIYILYICVCVRHMHHDHPLSNEIIVYSCRAIYLFIMAQVPTPTAAQPCAKKAAGTKKTRCLSACAAAEQPDGTWIFPGWLARLVTPMLYMGVSKNTAGPPKWMVKIRENPY